MTAKELIKEILKEKYDVKNLPIIIKLPTGETFDAGAISKYDDMVIIDATPQDVKLENGEALFGT